MQNVCPSKANSYLEEKGRGASSIEENKKEDTENLDQHNRLSITSQSNSRPALGEIFGDVSDEILGLTAARMKESFTQDMKMAAAS